MEDNADNRVIYRTILEFYGFEVMEAVDGPFGIQLVREQLPDLVVMDVSIPIIDGLEATRILKADPATAVIPIMALTAHAMPEDRARAAAWGCDAYLAKPAQPKAVLMEVERLLRERDRESIKTRG